MIEIRKVAGIYFKNFLRLTLPYILPVGGYSFSPVRISTPLAIIFAVVYFFAIGITVMDVWGALNDLSFGLLNNIFYVIRKIPQLIISLILVLPPGVLIFYLFLNFFSYYLFVLLAAYPFFIIYVIPISLIGCQGPLKSIKSSFELAWEHPGRTALLTFPPVLIITYLFVYSWRVFNFLFFVPIWVTLITQSYCKIVNCKGPTSYFQ